MSNHLISLAYKVDVAATPVTRRHGLLRKAVLVLLADKASDDGSGIYASKQTFADELCCSKQSVITTMQQFEEEGLLIKIGDRPCRTGYTTEYRLNVHRLAQLPRVPRWSKRSTELTGQTALPVKTMEGRGQQNGPKPSRNLNTKKGKDHAREIDDNWQPSLGPETETGKFTAAWPREFFVSEVERFIAHHKAKETKSKNFNLQWKTWALGPYCREALREWNSERPSNGQTGNAFVRAAASRIARGSAGARASGASGLR